MDAAVIRLTLLSVHDRFESAGFRILKLAIRGTFDNGMMLIDADGADNFGIYDCVIDSGYNHSIAMPCPANTNTWGVSFPNSWANNFISCDNTMIRGFYDGATMTHHLQPYNLQI